MPPPYHVPKPNATFIIKSVVIQNMITKLKKSFPLVCRACRDESIDI